MSRPVDHGSWLKGVLQVRRPIHFFALALTLPNVLLVALLWNEPVVRTLGREGLLRLITTGAVVQVAALVLGTFFLCHQRGPEG